MEKPENYTQPNRLDEQNRDSGSDMRIENGAINIRNNDGTVRWVGIARNAYNTSTDYFDANIRRQVERNLRLFQSKHPVDSKYYKKSFQYRSKLFRPKTRAMTRRHEATAAQAFFATADAVSCVAEDQNNADHVAGANFAMNLVNYRLEHSIPWFLTVVGGYQDAMVAGVVISRQEWVYKTKKVKKEVPKLDESGMVQLTGEKGNFLTETVTEEVVEEDRPDITLLPTENFRFDPACDWRDPVDDSPYLIEMMPMYVYQVQERMKSGDEKTGEAKWHHYTDGQIKSAVGTGNYDSTRMVREKNREDSKDIKHETSVFDIVWVHRNIINIEGEDWLYYTLGTEFLLSDPVPLTDIYRHGRPYAVGTANIETHKVYAAGVPELGENLQNEANEIANGRLDNIKLILNKRHYAKRGTNVDWRALTTSIPGGVVLMDNLNDVKEEASTDITSSSYQEQDRINVDFDELMGTFSQGSVQSNRSLNETVGGMNLAQDDSNLVSEYQLRVYVETWVESVLKQMLSMEIHYETDERILGIAAGDYDVTPEQVEKLIKSPMAVRVAVGFGATSPFKRISKLSLGLSTLVQYAPAKMQSLNIDEITKEIFGALGYRDGSRFFIEQDDEDPRVIELTQKLQEAMEVIRTKQVEAEGRIRVAEVNNEGKAQVIQMQLDHKGNLERINQKLKLISEQVAAEKNDIARGELILQKEALEYQKKTEEIHMLIAERDKLKNGNIEKEERDRDRRMVPEADGGKGDGLPDDRGSTVMANNNYQNVPQAEY